MIGRLAALVLVVAASAAPAQDETGRIVYLGMQDDPYYDPQPVYTGLSLRDRVRPVAGARVAMRDARVLARAIGVSFALDEVLLEDVTSAVQAVRDARADGALGVLLDLPPDAMAAVVSAAGGEDLLLFNIRHRDMRWREAECAPAVLHTIPSRAMLADALAQYLRGRGWDRILLLASRSEEDAAESVAARRSAAKFGLKIVAEKAFELSNDPRERDLNNVALMTSGVDYDVVWLVDAEGEFGRYVPFATYLPRPVVGAEGLGPVAWHWTYERHGAPQLNQRFRRDNDRDMSSEDWAAWAAARALVESVSRTGSVDRAEVASFLTSDRLSLDLYKGVPGSFRSWNGQLRQPILLATHNAVIGLAPLEAFKHQTNMLDTLGVDLSETQCLEH